MANIINSIRWPVSNEYAGVTANCPNCGATTNHRTILCTSTPDKTAGPNIFLLRCSICQCGFFFPGQMADYRADGTGGEAALAFYLQQGAGLFGIVSNLANLERPAGTRFLEVGCGFGFGLDFAKRTLGWDVLGFDPSPFAAAGRIDLRLPIESRYLLAYNEALTDRFDVVMASEVIEHVPSPATFVRTLQSVLCVGGTLILTTPNVEAVKHDTPHGLLVPLLSIGYHLVLQSEYSLRELLGRAGFTDIAVHRSGSASLVARCRRGRAANVVKPAPDRNLYRLYLQDAASAAEPDGDLWFGLTARAYRAAVGAADVVAADVLWTSIAAACGRRFNFDVEARSDLDDGEDTLESLVAREPLCLGSMLLHRAFHHLLRGRPRIDVEGLFANAAAASKRLQKSLQRIGVADGDSEDLAWVAEAEGLLCAAERGAEGLPERFAALGLSPSDAVLADSDAHPRRTDFFRRRMFVSLVNSARLDDAGCFADVIAIVEARAAGPGVLLDDELDVLFCAAAWELQHPKGTALRALGLLQSLQISSETAHAAGHRGSAKNLVKPCRSAKVLALNVLGRTEEASALRKAY